MFDTNIIVTCKVCCRRQQLIGTFESPLKLKYLALLQINRLLVHLNCLESRGARQPPSFLAPAAGRKVGTIISDCVSV